MLLQIPIPIDSWVANTIKLQKANGMQLNLQFY